MELIIENVRSFVGRHDIPIRPLTLLVGENSSGKSTLLSLLSAVSDPFGFPFRPSLNSPPYNLGNFDTIATSGIKKSEHADYFRIGYTVHDWDEDKKSDIIARYLNRNGAIELADLEAVRNLTSAKITFEHNMGHTNIGWSARIANDNLAPYHYTFGAEISPAFNLYSLMGALPGARSGFLSKEDRMNPTPERLLFRTFTSLFDDYMLNGTVSLAPVRMEPKRTYDIITEDFSPKGEHIPFVLPSLLNDVNRRKILENFGAESGLFKKIEVSRLGNYNTDPARVMVTGSGPTANLIDTGYGVSQALPVLVESIRARPDTMLLLQQPEVHLHPRAQAALGTLFVELIKAENKQFVVETHSDYIIDRVRIEVAKGNIAAEDVQILYFEKPKNATRIYPITMDEIGNLQDVPPTYRAFFLEEAWGLMERGTG